MSDPLRDHRYWLEPWQKLRVLIQNGLDTIEWDAITPNAEGDWIEQRDITFGASPVLGAKDARTAGPRVFVMKSSGLKTSRDSWCYNFSRVALAQHIKWTIQFYNGEVDLLRILHLTHFSFAPKIGKISTATLYGFLSFGVHSLYVAQALQPGLNFLDEYQRDMNESGFLTDRELKT